MAGGQAVEGEMKQVSKESVIEGISRRKKRPKRGDRGEGGGLAARVRKIEKILASAAWEAYGEMFGREGGSPRSFPLELKVVIEPGKHWRMLAAPPLEEQIRRAVRDMATRADVVRSGRVYCYRCESSRCPHSQPPRPGSVFGGYSSTGLPLWPELTQALLDLRHPRVDCLYRPSGPALLAAYMSAETLKSRQLNIFGKQSKTYDILGQVVFGFMHIPWPALDGGEVQRVAFTLQAVESRRRGGAPRLDLNVLGRLWDGTPAIEALAGPFPLRVLQIIAEARHRIQQMTPSRSPSGRWRERLSPEVPARVEQTLKDVTRSLERLGRQQGRRTIHAEERRGDNRPTSKAWEDAAAAPLEQILWDEYRHTVVVAGPKNRVHIFSPEARHITTLRVDPEAVRKRVQRRRWRRLTGELLELFGASVGRMGRKPGSKTDGSQGGTTRGAGEPPPARNGNATAQEGADSVEACPNAGLGDPGHVAAEGGDG